jgi:hypothetical protein
MGLATLLACQPTSVDKPCYTCTIYSTDSAPQTEQVCGQSEMEQYVKDKQANPGTTLVSCTNL